MCLKKILYLLSGTPDNVYLDKYISFLGGLEAEILTRMSTWSANLLNSYHWSR